MGADGGICWIIVNEPYNENWLKLHDLLPWPLKSWDKSRDEDNDEYLHEIPHQSFPTTYGSFQEFSIDDLVEIWYERDEVFQHYGKNSTLEDFLLFLNVEHAEEPWSYANHRFVLSSLFFEAFKYESVPRGSLDFSLTLEQWYEEVFSRIKTELDSERPFVWHQQTWT